MLHSRTTVEFMIRSPLAHDFALLLFRPQVGYDSAAAFSRVFSRVSERPPPEFDALRDSPANR